MVFSSFCSPEFTIYAGKTPVQNGQFLAELWPFFVKSKFFVFFALFSMSCSNQDKACFYEWWIESNRSHTVFTRRVQKELCRNAHVPSKPTMLDWQAKFHENASLQRRSRTNTQFVSLI